MEENGEFDLLPKKEVLGLKKEMNKLEANLGGIKEMKTLPGAMFIVDPHNEDIAVQEARKLHIPIIAITDTNCDPDLIDYVIPGNDDAIRAVKLLSSVIANAVIEANQGEAVNAEMQQAAAEVAAEQSIEEVVRRKRAPAEEARRRDCRVSAAKPIHRRDKKMAITASDVNALRQKTGVGMMDCKKALTEANGDMDKAVEILREKGMATAAKKAGRIAAEGIVDSYIHMGGKVGVLVEVNCETDFVARGDQFKALVHDIALQIAAAKPLYVTKEEVPAEVLEEEKKILKIQAMNEGKPEAIAEKMVQGRIKKYYEDFCLLEQPFVKDSSKTIGQLITEAIASIGEKITVRRFARFEMGEGIEKKKDDLAEEVEKQVSKMKG